MAGLKNDRTATIIEFLPRAVLLRLLGVLLIVLGPHLARLPLWAALLVAAIGVWRLLAAMRQWRQPPRWMRSVLAIGAFAGVFATFGRVSGQTAGVVLLTVMAALKLTELHRRRDVMVMVMMMYFILVTHFLFSQEIWTAAYLLICAVLITATLVDANHPAQPLPLRDGLRIGGRLILHSLPLMVILFILFPRLPGPLWGLPSDAGAGRSGLSDEMAPGDIANLIESDEVAFRVRFEGDPPPMRTRYWRGPVLGSFVGRRWQIGQRPGGVIPTVELAGPAVRYQVDLEPNARRWLFALDLPWAYSLPSDASLNVDFNVLAPAEIKDRRSYHLESHIDYRFQTSLPPALRQAFLHLPAGYNPRTVALARSWRDSGMSDPDIVAAALKLFGAEEFYYTLHPPMLGRDSVDEFLFVTHRGFCEHYSSSFTVLMRAAGIPARVVTGYEGGIYNDVGGYYVVRQSDAHAWSEVWLQGRGWVRVDPTAVVSPQRVESGIGAALRGTGDLPAALDPSRRGYLWRLVIEERWDWLNMEWNHWVLGFGPSLQEDLLRQFGLVDWSDMILALTALVAIALGLLSLVLARQLTLGIPADPAVRAWRRLQRRLRRTGVVQRPDEGPQDFIARVAAARPDLASALEPVTQLYLQLRYLQEPSVSLQRELRARVAALRV